MPQVNRSVLVAYSAEQMYELVNDAEFYPEFLPGCVDSKIISRTETTQVASIEVAKIGIRKTFTTSNRMTPNRRVELDLVEGPFKSLKGEWNFIPLGDNACKIEFQLDFEFNNPIIDFAFAKIFNEFMGSMVQAFTRRAKQIYG